MIDIKDLIARKDYYKQVLASKNSQVSLVDDVENLYEQRKALQAVYDQQKAEQNKLVKMIPQLSGAEKEATLAASKKLAEVVKELGAKLAEVDAAYMETLLRVPNGHSEDTPFGKDDSENVVLRQVGTPRAFPFEPKEHFELGKELDIIDIERAAKVTGARFAYLKGDLALMEFALVQFVMKTLTDRSVLDMIIRRDGLQIDSTPFVPIVPPVMIRPESLQMMGRLEPKEERYHTEADDLYLIGSAEHTIGAMHMQETLDLEHETLRYIGFSTSFRREAGSYGKDTRGILRMHQFDKLEMETFTTKERGLDEQNLLVALQEHLMQQLGLPYQIVICCTGDMGDPDYRHIDLETWMPGQALYRETHSSDYMTDYQARRLGIRYKTSDGNAYVHMNDATAIAIGRTLIAIMENYQEEDGSIIIPDVLRAYMGKDRITKS